MENNFFNISNTLAKDLTASHSLSQSHIVPKVDDPILTVQSPSSTSYRIQNMTF